MPSFTTKTVLSALAAAASVSAHGHVTSVAAGGKTYTGFNPFNGNNPQPDAVGWKTGASDNGFVLPTAFGTDEIACHRGSGAAQSSVTVAAGEKMTITWDTWPASHKGPVLDYLAACPSGGCSSAAAGDLSFFKIDEAGLEGGKWASDALMDAGMKWDVTIPADLAAGEYVLRHEMIALHEGDRLNQAQNYPQCINLIVTGGGSLAPAGVKATALYKANDAGINFNIYNSPTSYPIPGPAVISAGSGGGSAPAPVTPPTTTTPPPAATSPAAPTQPANPPAASQPATPAPTTPEPCARKARRAARAARRAAALKARGLTERL